MSRQHGKIFGTLGITSGTPGCMNIFKDNPAKGLTAMLLSEVCHCVVTKRPLQRLSDKPSTDLPLWTER